MLFGNIEAKLDRYIGKGKADKIIKILTTTKNQDVIAKCIEALGGIKGEESFNTLIQLLRSPVDKCRELAATALGNYGDNKAHARIDQYIKVEQNPEVVAAMRAALNKLHTNN